jgi:hypothetical protein
MHIYLIGDICFSLSNTACTASPGITPLAQFEPILELVEILEEIQCW